VTSCTQVKTVRDTTKKTSQATATEDGLRLRSGEFKNLKAEDIAKYAITTPAPFTHFMFGYIDPEDPEATFRISSQVPFKVGMYYGWALKPRDGTAATWKLEEVLTLPEPARVFRVHSGRSKVSADGTEVTSTLSLATEDGWLFNFWQLTLGDPEGDYQMSLSYSAQPIVTHKFKVAR
jgi:hypothetical protein